MYRESDPATSREAAADVPITTAQTIAMTAARNLCVIYGDCTANEIADIGAGLGVSNAETIRKRINELTKKRLLVIVGLRRCRVTGKRATVYQVIKFNQ